MNSMLYPCLRVSKAVAALYRRSARSYLSFGTSYNSYPSWTVSSIPLFTALNRIQVHQPNGSNAQCEMSYLIIALLLLRFPYYWTRESDCVVRLRTVRHSPDGVHCVTTDYNISRHLVLSSPKHQMCG